MLLAWIEDRRKQKIKNLALIAPGHHQASPDGVKGYGRCDSCVLFFTLNI
jgi:hypothetical protein